MPGRGRGRHLPINYPDGLLCKPTPTDPYPLLEPESMGPPPSLTAADKELLAIRRRLSAMPAAQAFHVHGTQPEREFVRYSDRYRDAPKEPFDKSSVFSMRRNVH